LRLIRELVQVDPDSAGSSPKPDGRCSPRMSNGRLFWCVSGGIESATCAPHIPKAPAACTDALGTPANARRW
ncbi:MAG: hypothetical protein M3R24_06115, partial [Chloroflexota bacterium]|nr:hypothetical protein [Chloroflexota bacterium]